VDLLGLSCKFKVKCVQKKCFELLRSQIVSIERACEFIEFSGTIRTYSPVEHLIQESIGFLVSKFKYLVQFMNSEDYLNLSMNAIVELLKSDEIIVDSENTIFYALIMWIKWNHIERIPLMEHLLYCIRFPLMSKYFLKYIVPHVAHQFPEKLRDQIMEMCSFGLEAKFANQTKFSKDNPVLSKQFIERVPYPCKNLSVNFKFVNMSQMDTTNKIHSEPVFWCGYEFSYFLSPFKMTSSETSPISDELSCYALAGFLRCTSRLLPHKHYLPVSYSISIPYREHASERKFGLAKVIFESPDKAIGSKLTLPNENLSHIISGESLIVTNDSLTVTVELELLESDEECMLIR